MPFSFYTIQLFKELELTFDILRHFISRIHLYTNISDAILEPHLLKMLLQWTSAKLNMFIKKKHKCYIHNMDQGLTFLTIQPFLHP